MLLGFFLSPERRLEKRNRELFLQAAAIYEKRKLGFRGNAISKLSFLHPGMKFLMNTQCNVFAGLDASDGTFIWGYFDDEALPKLEDLRDSLQRPDFPDRCRAFVQGVKSYTKPRRFNFLRGPVDEDGFFYIGGCFVFDVRVGKNGKVIARSNASEPKPVGYFRRKLYEHIVQKTSGTGASNITIVFQVSNFGEGANEKIYFVYPDPHRKDESQFRENYVKVCSLFLPFLEACEQQLWSKEFEDGGLYCVTNWDRGKDSKVIGSFIKQISSACPLFLTANKYKR